MHDVVVYSRKGCHLCEVVKETLAQVQGEHFLLNEMMARMQTRDICYWRDKRGHEIDFVLANRGRNPIAIECTWSADRFDPANFEAFRYLHPDGENVVLAADIKRSSGHSYGPLKVTFESLESFASRMAHV